MQEDINELRVKVESTTASLQEANNELEKLSELERRQINRNVITDATTLQCNELNPTFFCHSQDYFRTKESEFVHFGPITAAGLTAKSCLFPSTKRQLNIY